LSLPIFGGRRIQTKFLHKQISTAFSLSQEKLHEK